MILPCQITMDNDWFFTGRRCLSIAEAEAWPEEPEPEVPVPPEPCPRQAIAPTPREETVAAHGWPESCPRQVVAPTTRVEAVAVHGRPESCRARSAHVGAVRATTVACTRWGGTQPRRPTEVAPPRSREAARPSGFPALLPKLRATRLRPRSRR